MEETHSKNIWLFSFIYNVVIVITMLQCFVDRCDLAFPVSWTCVIFLLFDACAVCASYHLKKVNLQTLLKCFIAFPNTQTVIDWTEVYVQQVPLFQHVNKCLANIHTFLVGILPSGFVLFVSDAFGDHTSWQVHYKSVQNLLDCWCCHCRLLVDEVLNAKHVQLNYW